MTKSASRNTWMARLLVAAVFIMNVTCALQFIFWPERYTGSYELAGPGAQAAVVGLGIAFAMWNATYPPVIVHPQRYRVLFGVVLVQQAIGLAGETLLRASLDPSTTVLAHSIGRFIAFDTLGLALLAAAFAITRKTSGQTGIQDEMVE